MLFRYALRQLALGAHPNKPGWVVRRDYPVLLQGSALQELKQEPPLWGWPIEEQRQLINVLRTADIAHIASTCTFPDWLGYMGLALHYTEDAEHETHLLTRAWAPQLALLVPSNSLAASLMGDLAGDSTRTLTWRHLECVESSFLARRR